MNMFDITIKSNLWLIS